MCFPIFLERKNVFLRYKKSLQSRKIEIFPKKLTHGFGPRMAIFLTFFLRQCRPGKCVSRYSRGKKDLLGYENKKVQKVEK